ncbi:MAG: glycosyltransferase family 9 protein [Cytophagaceae bacterium]
MNKPFKKILIIQTAFLGDVILASPIIEKLHAFFPEARLDFLVRKGNESLLDEHPYLSRIFILDKKIKFRSIADNIRKIRKENYDLVVNAQRFATSGLITVLSGARHTVGFSKNPFSFFFTEKISHEISKSGGKHEVDRNIDLIKAFTDDRRVRPRLYATQKDRDSSSIYKGMAYLCIAPASVWFTKQFPKEKWIEFIDQLPIDIKVYLLGAPSDKELCREIAASSNHPGVLNLAGKLSLLASAELMKDAVINYVNDSAPLHLASEANAPVCAVYCSTVPEFGFGPLSEFSRVVELQKPLYCRPCNLHGYKKCPEGHFKCALDIQISQLNEVLQDAMKFQLANPK